MYNISNLLHKDLPGFFLFFLGFSGFFRQSESPPRGDPPKFSYDNVFVYME